MISITHTTIADSYISRVLQIIRHKPNKNDNDVAPTQLKINEINTKIIIRLGYNVIRAKDINKVLLLTDKEFQIHDTTTYTQPCWRGSWFFN